MRIQILRSVWDIKLQLNCMACIVRLEKFTYAYKVSTVQSSICVSLLSKIQSIPLNIFLLACIFCYFVAYPKASFIESTCTINRLFGLGSAQESNSTYLFPVVVHLSSPRYIHTN
jgi:hypothetical protein